MVYVHRDLIIDMLEASWNMSQCLGRPLKLSVVALARHKIRRARHCQGTIARKAAAILP